MLGVEMAATRVRWLVQGLSVTAGRLGAALGVFVFPRLFERYGQSFAVAFLAITALLGAALTLVGIPETARSVWNRPAARRRVESPRRHAATGQSPASPAICAGKHKLSTLATL